LLKRRDLHHGWGHVAHAVPPGTACHSKWRYSRGDGIMHPGKRPPCASVPAGYVVQTDFGFCELMRTFANRSCRYMTLLREPVSRMASDWNYFCVDCAEGGKRCPAQHNQTELMKRVSYNHALRRDEDRVPLSRPMNSCPKMGFVDFAKYEGNIYLKAFGGDLRAITSGQHVPASQLSESADLERALLALHRPDMLVLITEELSHGALPMLWEDLGESMALPNIPHRNSHGHDHVPTANETQAVGKILTVDTQLYESIPKRPPSPPPAASAIMTESNRDDVVVEPQAAQAPP